MTYRLQHITCINHSPPPVPVPHTNRPPTPVLQTGVEGQVKVGALLPCSAMAQPPQHAAQRVTCKRAYKTEKLVNYHGSEEHVYITRARGQHALRNGSPAGACRRVGHVRSIHERRGHVLSKSGGGSMLRRGSPARAENPEEGAA